MAKFLLIFLFLLFTSTAVDPTCNSGDKAVLLKVKQALGNPDILSSWTPNSDCCQWELAFCSPTTGRITNLAIANDNLSAQIPAIVADLPYLETLQFDSLPNLRGPIPAAITKLRRLRTFTVTGSQLSGDIPNLLAEITTLELLDLDSNALTGTIPSWLAALPNLYALDFSNNRLAGPIPDSLGGSPNLRYLRLSGNLLAGPVPPSFSKLSLSYVYLGDNRLSGDALPLFDSSKPTVELNISHNSFSFDLTKAGYPGNMTLLDISHNKIYGNITSGIKKVPLECRKFNMSYNRLCGRIPHGRWLRYFDATCFFHNLCLCGDYLQPCVYRKPIPLS